MSDRLVRVLIALLRPVEVWHAWNVNRQYEKGRFQNPHLNPYASSAVTTKRVDDGARPHRFPQSAIGEEILGWECQACGEWIREFGPRVETSCSVDWRNAS